MSVQAPPAYTGTTDESSPEDTKEQSSQEILKEEIPELGAGSYMLQFVGALGLLHVSKRAKVIDAIARIKDKKTILTLLHKNNISNPIKFEEVKNLIKSAEKEIEWQKKRWGEESRNYIEVGSGPLKQRITFDELERRKESFQTALNTHRKVNGEVITQKISTTSSVYQLNEESKRQLQQGMAKWLKENPGRTIDDYLVVQGRNIARTQITSSEKRVDEKVLDSQQRWLTGQQTRKERVKGLLEQREEQVIHANLTTRREAGKEMARQLNTPASLRLTQHVTPQSIPSGQKISLPRISNFKSKIFDFFKRTAALQFARTAMRNAIASSLVALRGAGLLGRSVAKFGLGLAKQAFPFLFRAGATTVGAAASLGATLAIQAGLEVLKKIPLIGDLVKGLEDAMFQFIKYAALFAVGVPVVIIVLFIFGLSSSNIIPSFSSQDAMVASSPKTTVYSWGEFEKTFLTQTTSWDQFAKENLTQ